MRTTLDIDQELLEELLRVTKERSKSRAVNRALREYLRRLRLKELRQMSGEVELREDWEELREMELDE